MKKVINWFKKVKTWKKIFLIIDILVLLSIFLFPIYIFPEIVLFTIITIIILPWAKSNKKLGIKFGLLGLIIGFLPILLNRFEIIGVLYLPFVPLLQILGLKGEQFMVLIPISLSVYCLIGVLIGYFIGAKKK